MLPQLIYPLYYKTLPSNKGAEPAESLNTETTTMCLQAAEKVLL